jgi:ATPase subunit of ABC transporter with duplicated ATPase domains
MDKTRGQTALNSYNKISPTTVLGRCTAWRVHSSSRAKTWTKIRSLSGGEKSRLAIARVLYNPPNFLVLDEATNHLDLATKEMLVDALKYLEGTMIFVSHDRMFLRGLGSRVLELGGESGRTAILLFIQAPMWNMFRSLDMRQKRLQCRANLRRVH